MKKRRVGIITFSDGRDFVHKELVEMNKKFEDKLAEALEGTGEVELVRGSEIVWKPSIAKKVAKELLKADVEMTIFNYSIWCWPHLTVIASLFAPGPFLMFGHINPKYPGMVGLLAASGALEQIGIYHKKLWGNPEDEEVLGKLLSFIRAATTVNRLKGERYGKFGGRPMGMYTAAANGDQWMKEFGIDVEQIDQYELVLRAEKVPKEKLEKARRWLEELSTVKYDGKQLTPEKLEKQIALYYAAKNIIEEYELDFVGFKGQPEITNNYATMDVAEAFLNDPYDFDGPKEPIVAATETDMDGALSMEILKHISGQPVLFADVRHYFEKENILDLCNSGTHATYFAAKSYNPEENLKKVVFYPEIFYFPAGGAAVRHFAAPGEMTFARLTRKNGKYHMLIMKGEVLDLPEDEKERLANEVQPEWPHVFVRLNVDMDTFLHHYPCNHTHGVYGDYVSELVEFCKIKGIDHTILS
ncbi:MAG: L-fucose/L-arabinose isomerase family protein [Thermotogaceae bacterium]|nr:L-fucose/L-arabinose isomerase family protein [Thermotogaceae bacterium]